MPSVDINSVGAGGGSIAWFERDGLLKVGPASAGAVPGPACYGKGGDRPTVSDANLVLGRLSPDGLLGGKMPLQVEAARAVLAPVAERLGFTIEHAAQGVLSIVVSNMVRAIRAISVERGHDPRKFALLPFGGAGPLHASDVARSLGIREIVVPLAPGILCAQGLVVSDLKESFVRTRRTRLDQDGAPTIARILDELRAEARAWFVAERVAEADRIIRGALEMRYVGQNFELSVPLNAEELTNPDIEIVRQRFFKVHESNYGYFNPQDPVDIINYRLTGLGRLSRPKPQPSTIGISGAAVPIARRRIFFDAAVAMESAVYDRSTLLPGHELVGPAVVEQFDSTTLLYPGNRARVDQALNLIIEVAL